MAESAFIRRLKRARREGEKKLKIIAPKYTPPPAPSYDRARDGPKISSGSSRPSPTPAPTPAPMSTIKTPTAPATVTAAPSPKPTLPVAKAPARDPFAQFLFGRVLGADPETLEPLPRFKTGREFSVRYGLTFAGRRLAKPIEEKFNLGPLEKPAPTWLAEIAAEYPTFAAVGPLIKTGTAQRAQSKYVLDVKTGKFVKKSDLRDYLSVKRDADEITILGKGGRNYQTKEQRLIELLRAAKTEKGIKEALQAAEDVYGKQFIRDFSSRFAYARSLVRPQQIPAPAVKPASPRVEIQLPRVTQLRFLEELGAAVTPIGKGKTARARITSSAFAISPLISFRQEPQPRTQPDIFTATTTITGQKTTPETRQVPRVKTVPRLAIPLPTVPKIPTPRAPGGRGFRRAAKPKRPVKTKIPKFEEERVLLPTPATGKQGWIPQAKTKKGKWKALSKKPMTRSAALGRMAQAVDNTVSAQGRVIKVKGSPSKIRNDYFFKNQKKFRPYKVVKGRPIALSNRFIEKTKYRIDTRGEKLGLNLAKYSKNKRWGI